MIKIFTHRDLDGAVSEILLRSLYPEFEVFSTPCSYSDVDSEVVSFFRKGRDDDFDKILFSDLEMSQNKCFPCIKRAIKKHPEKVFVYDHHPTSLRLEDLFPENVLVDTDESASTLIYNVEDVDEKYYKLSKLARDHDLWERNYQSSQYLSYLYYFYWHHEFVNRFSDGNLRMTENERTFLKKHHNKLENIREKENPDVFLDGFIHLTRVPSQFRNWIMADVLEENENVVAINIEPSGRGVSFRTCRDDLDIGQFLERHGGGGHPKAGGIKYDGEVFKDIMEDLADFAA